MGAGGALPSIISYHNGAKKVVVTDYPDADLIENITYNVNLNKGSSQQIDSSAIVIKVWFITVNLIDNVSKGTFVG